MQFQISSERSRLGFLGFQQFYFVRCRRQHIRPVEKSRYSRFTSAENTTSSSPEVTEVEFLECDRRFCFISISKLTASRILLQQFRFILLVRTKEISMSYGSNTGSWKLCRWVGLIFTMSTYISIPTWIHPQNSVAATEASSLKKHSRGTSLKW